MDEIWKIYNKFKSVEADLITLLRYIDLDEQHYKTNSAAIRKLILSSCSNIELTANFFANELGDKIPKTKEESLPSKIYNLSLQRHCPLFNIIPNIQNQKFTPWQPKIENNKCKFTWWEAYIACKHEKHYKDIEYFKSAIESVAALFSVTVFLTSKTKIGIFWHLTDFIKIQTESKKPSSIYNSQTTLRKQIWPDLK